MKFCRITLLLVVSFSFHFATAQLADTYEKGFIVTNDGVKMDGYIKTDDLSHLSSEVCFKASEQDKKCISYNATQVKSFETESGKHFDMFSVTIDNNNTPLPVFANLILKGETSLYKTNSKSRTFFIVTKKDVAYVLQNDEFTSGETTMKRFYYQGVLNIATEGFSTRKYPDVSFSESDFIRVISEYNASKGYESKTISYMEKNIRQVIVSVGGGAINDETELFFQAMYRIYYPKLSRSTSLNVGLQYFNYKFFDSDGKVRESLISLPLQFQQNILNKNIRPFVFLGVNLSYLNIVDNKNNSLIEHGFQKNFGVGSIYGAGIEVDVFKGLVLKAEYRYQLFSHLPLFSIGYNFSK